MGKKLISLLLCLLFVCTALAACGETKIDEARDYIENPDNQISTGREAVTLSFCIPCEFDPTTEENKKAIEKMQENFNAIVSAKYRTSVVFTFVKTDTTQEDTAKALADYNAKVNELLEAGEADIFLTTAYDDYTAKIRDGKLADLTAYVSESWRILSNPKYTDEKKTDYNPTISEAIFSNAYFCTEIFENNASEKAAERNETYFGIPSNYVVGSYKYLFVKKAEADRSYLNIDFPEDATASDTNAAALKAKDRLVAELKSQGKTDEEIKQDYVIDLTGTYGDRFKYDANDYYVTVLSKPEISYADICDTMFCVASASKHSDRAFEVLREINSNAQLHTILQYGARDINYTVNQADKTITLKNDSYKMNMKYTGNCLAIYPCTNYADTADAFYREEMAYASSYENLKYASLQNRDLASPAVPVTNRYKSQLALLKAFETQKAGNEKGTSADGVLGNRAVTFNYVTDTKFSIATADNGTLFIEVNPKDGDGYTGCSFTLTYEYIEETDAGTVKRTLDTTSVTQIPQNSYNLKFTYQPSGGENYNDTVTLSPETFTSETAAIALKDSTYSTFAAETLRDMLGLFSDWLKSSGSGLTLADFGFTKF